AVPFEWLHHEEAAERWPGLVFQPGERLLFQADAGVVSAERAVRAMARAADAAGAEIREEAPAQALAADGDGVEVRTPSGPVRAGVAVAAVGAWLPALLPSAGIEVPLTVTLEQVTYFCVDPLSTL